jgi:hypothetical protein
VYGHADPGHQIAISLTMLWGLFVRLTRALRPGGVLYMSFKLGESEEVRDGRLFNDYTEGKLRQVLERHPLLVLLRVWLTEDLRPGQRGRTWVNALLRKPRQA